MAISASVTVTVVSSPEAMAAIDGMTRIINDALPAHFDSLRRQAGVLRDPANWDGTTATAFRDTLWPSYEKTLHSVHEQLDNLRLWLSEILIEIQDAG